MKERIQVGLKQSAHKRKDDGYRFALSTRKRDYLLLSKYNDGKGALRARIREGRGESFL